LSIEEDRMSEESVFDERKCCVCGCTDMDPCFTDGIPCSWLLDNLCDACVVEIPGTNVVYEKMCRYCDNLVGDLFQGKPIYTCCAQETPDGESFYFRMSGEGGLVAWFAWSGIWKPNKSVAAAQRRCPWFILSELAGTKHINRKERTVSEVANG
jgi:hypothetical protein